jgi:hypothetical protein
VVDFSSDPTGFAFDLNAALELVGEENQVTVVPARRRRG